MSKKVVDAKFLNDVAKKIHDGHSGKYLRLCTGTLQNGPDPVDGVRTMHCGLGELYFQLTGRQPEDDDVDEEGVVEECLSRTSLMTGEKLEALQDKAAETMRKSLEKLNLPKNAVEDMVQSAVDSLVDADLDPAVDNFRHCLHQIPRINDNTGARTGVGAICSMGDFKRRSKAVAAVLREAAAMLK